MQKFIQLMSLRRAVAAALLFVFTLSIPLGASETESALADWQAKRFGMFIHWGPVSAKVTEIGWSRGAQVPASEYDQLYKTFDPVRFDADEWVAVAREAGMKYLVITSKHHDGFCLFDTAYSDYDIMGSPFKRDILAELSAACRSGGVEFSVYYSILDWYHPDYPLDSPGGRGKKAAHNMARYFEYVKNQTSEIIEKYGPLGLYWFDGEWEKPWTKEHGDALYLFLKEIQPSLVINNRVGKARHGMAGTSKQSNLNAGDYDTPEQRIGGFSRERPWETCMTICKQWAWKPEDRMKSLEECLRTLIHVVGGDGNFLFNVGPMPDGRIEPRQVERLREMGRWLDTFGDCVYGTRGGPFMPGKWGASTCKEEKINLFVFRAPHDAPLLLPAIDAKIVATKALTAETVRVEQRDDGILLDIPAQNRDAIATVIELTVDREAFAIEPVPVHRRGKPIAVKKTSASNVFQGRKEYDPSRAADDNEQTRWATDSGTKSAWIELDLGSAQRVSAAWISESYAGRVQAFTIDYLSGDQWLPCCKGTTLGDDFEVVFDAVNARRFRLNITSATEGPTIAEFQLFGR